MSINFDDIFHPEKRWKDKCLSDSNPCKECDVYKEYETKAIYGTIAERQCMEMPDSCYPCMKRLHWLVDCLDKLQWYENNDETLKKEK